MDRWLLIARTWYLCLAGGGLLAAAGGLGGAVAVTPAVIGAVVGVLGLAAAGWVRSESVPRGMLASIGIAIGPMAVVAVAVLWAVGVVAFGVLPVLTASAVASVPSAVAIAAAAIMWRGSARPWDGRPKPGPSHRPAPRA